MRRGFTLAETLVTLGIIGVVAAMTLPALVNKYQERTTVTKVKKFYSVINQALLLAIKDNGYVNEWNFYEKDDEEGGDIKSNKLAAYLKPYLKITKDCGENPGCIGVTYKVLSGEVWGADYNTKRYYKMILADGTYLWLRSNFNGEGMECTLQDGDVQNVCGALWVDVNGKNEPNTLGKDVFHFLIMKDRIIPNDPDDCNAGDEGWGCAKYILQNDNMNYLHK